jgi:spore maturation protein CgeB
VDILFVGSHTQYHRRRAQLVERLSQLGTRHNVVLRLQLSRMTLLADTPLGWVEPLRQHRLSPRVRALRKAPAFGRDLYKALGTAKIVVNCAIDMAGDDRGNMRCWEALGCGALMLSDTGNYPDGMIAGETIDTYATLDEMATKVTELLENDDKRYRMAGAGKAMIRTRYDKERQWADFLALL